MTDREEQLAAAVRSAVADAIREVLADKEAVGAFWGAAFAQLQERATTRTGRWVLGSVSAAASKLWMAVALSMLLYSLGGWAAVAKLWHSLWSAT